MSRDQAAAAQRGSAEPLTKETPQLVGLVAYLDRVWERNRKHRDTNSGSSNTSVSDQMIANLRARNSEYPPEKLSAIEKEGGTPIYMGITEVKCNHGESWLLDIFTSNEKSWGIEPTPEPSPGPQVRERATEEVLRQLRTRLQSGEEVSIADASEMASQIEVAVEQAVDREVWERSKKMETRIHDQLVQGGFHLAFEEFIADLVALKAGILKGPVVRNHVALQWKPTEEGTFSPVISDELRPEIYRVSPMDFYPDPDSADMDEGNIVEEYDISRAELTVLRDMDESGYDSKAIDKVLEEFDKIPDASFTSEERARAELEGKSTGTIGSGSDDAGDLRSSRRAREFWVSVQGKTLREHGRTRDDAGNPLIDLDEYEINAIMIERQLIFLDFNPDPLNRRPYFSTGWSRVPGSFWHKGVPERMSDLQQICNAAGRALVRNLGMASGPQAEVDMSRIPPGENIEGFYPMKIWQTTNRGNSSAPAIRFFQPDSRATELFGVYESFAQLADDYTGIPAYAFGSDKVAGAGRTSSGLSMLMSASAKGIKRVILNIDLYVIQQLIQRMFDYNMQYDPDPDIKGDMQIVTTGAVALMAKEQMASKRMEFLQATNNDVDLRLIGLENRANVLRATGQSLEIEGQTVVKTREEIRDMVASEEGQAAQLGQQAAQLEQAKMQAETQKLVAETELARARAQVEIQTIQLEAEKVKLEQQKLTIMSDKNQADAQLRGADLSRRSVVDAATLLGDVNEPEETPAGSGGGVTPVTA